MMLGRFRLQPLLKYAGSTTLALCLAGYAWGQAGIDGSTYEAEDFDVQEEGIVFDYPRTGLTYRRNLYIEGDNVTFVPQQPTAHNDTRDTRQWKVFISHWEQDPPSHINVWVRDDTPYHYEKSAIDLRVTIGHYDRAKNMVPANQVIRKGIPISNGLTRIPINIHNYPGDIVWVNLLGVNQKLRIQAIDVTDD
jgi:hypothetical protein